jgi:hypothetical protein
MSGYGDFRILLDSPADDPALGFDQFADAFLEIVEESDPRFAVGIFGTWGSGKTTLMRAIEKKASSPRIAGSVVPVWFNAWRYEREEHLIVPMLDTLRDALFDWANEHKGDPGVREKAVHAAAVAGRAARAIFAGVTLKAKSPSWMGGLDVGFDGSKFLSEVRQGNDDEEAADTPQSFYHASFKAMKEAFDSFVVDEDDHQKRARDTDEQRVVKRRIVVFVDDLDRCLPLNALEVLESMKLFFDLDGFIFVVALDREVVERVIEAKYGGERATAIPANGEREPTIRGSEYIKKIFQVPFALPPVAPEQLDEFMDALAASLPAEQAEDLQNRVRPHLDYVVGATARVNPREVKRFVNAYLLQMKTRPMLQPDVVLAMQTLAFRSDWAQAYEALSAEPDAFVDAVRRQLDGNPNAVEDLWPELAGFVGELVEYLGTPAARSLLDAQVDLYIYSVESTRSVDPRLIEVYPRLGSVRRLLRRLDQGAAPTPDLREELSRELRSVVSLAGNLVTSPTGTALVASIQELVVQMPRPGPEAQGVWEPWRKQADMLLTRLRERLLSSRRASTVGPTSAL